jgi:hypothetical protein
VAGSDRDRRGYVFVAGDRILRAVSPSAAGSRTVAAGGRMTFLWDRRP